MSWVFPIKDTALGHSGTWGSLRFEFNCLLGVLMHARIDTLTHPHFWSLLPSSVFDWVVIAVSIRDTMTPLNTPLHSVSITLITLRAVFTGLSSFRLVPVSTVPDIEGLHLQKHITAGATHHHSCVAHITIFGISGWAPTDCEWPEPWIAFHLG